MPRFDRPERSRGAPSSSWHDSSHARHTSPPRKQTMPPSAKYGASASARRLGERAGRSRSHSPRRDVASHRKAVKPVAYTERRSSVPRYRSRSPRVQSSSDAHRPAPSSVSPGRQRRSKPQPRIATKRSLSPKHHRSPSPLPTKRDRQRSRSPNVAYPSGRRQESAGNYRAQVREAESTVKEDFRKDDRERHLSGRNTKPQRDSRRESDSGRYYIEKDQSKSGRTREDETLARRDTAQKASGKVGSSVVTSHARRQPSPRSHSAEDWDRKKWYGDETDKGHEYKKSTIRQRDFESDKPVRESSPPRAAGRHKLSYGQTCTSLHDRFSSADSAPGFVPKENITVGIERNIPGAEPYRIRRDFVSDDVLVPRRKDEGKKRLCDRLDFATRPEEEYSERRVVKVESSKSDNHPSRSHPPSTSRRRDNFEVRRDRFESDESRHKAVSLSDRWATGQEKRIEPVFDNEKMEFREETFRKDSDRYSTQKSSDPLRRSERDERSDPLRRGERDERYAGDRKYSEGSRPDVHRDVHRDDSIRTSDSRDRYQRNPTDLRFDLIRRRNERFDDRLKIQERDKDRAKDTRDRKRTMSDDFHVSDRTSLPDFSKRPDKFQFEEWMEKPEMVPKGTGYFEHDNRGEVDYWMRTRGRGRGTFRGRVRGRGRPWIPRGRGRGYFGGTWKHDKYEEVEEPSSTTGK